MIVFYTDDIDTTIDQSAYQRNPDLLLSLPVMYNNQGLILSRTLETSGRFIS